MVGWVSSGKSRILCYWGITKALAGERGALVSFSYRNLLDVLTVCMFESLEAFHLEPVKDWMFYKGDMAFVVRGQEIMLRSADDPNRLRGLNLGYFGLDEAREFNDRSVFDILIARLRNSEYDQWAISSTSMGRNWFWKLAQEDGLDSAFETGYGCNQNLTVIVQSSWENTFLPQAYLAELERRYSDQLAQQELYGKIVDFSAGIFHKKWFKTGTYFKPETGVRSWDLAASMNSWSDYTVGTLLSKRNGATWVNDVVRTKTMDLVNLIVETAMLDGPGVIVAIESTSFQAALTGSITGDARMAKYRVVAYKPDKDKFSRALPLASKFEQGIIRLCEAAWNTDLIDEFCSFTPETKGQHDDIVDSVSQGWYVLNRDPVIKTPPIGLFSWPNGKNIEEVKLVQHIACVELKEYKAYVVGARWHPIHAELEISDARQFTSINELAGFLKPFTKRYGCQELDSDEFKSLSSLLAKEKANVMTGKLDETGTIYELNKMVSSSKVIIKPDCLAIAELSSADPDNMGPYVKCILRIVQEIRAIKREMPRPLLPFEKQRKEYREKLHTNKSKKEGWVTT